MLKSVPPFGIPGSSATVFEGFDFMNSWIFDCWSRCFHCFGF